MSAKLSPSRSSSKTFCTGIRVPATQGLPKWTCGLTGMWSFMACHNDKGDASILVRSSLGRAGILFLLPRRFGVFFGVPLGNPREDGDVGAPNRHDAVLVHHGTQPVLLFPGTYELIAHIGRPLSDHRVEEHTGQSHEVPKLFRAFELR